MTEPTTRRRMPAAQRREQLLVVGRAAFAEAGYDAVTVEEIAQRAGVTKPVVYEHFRGKDGLYSVIIEREVERLLTRVTSALAAGGTRARLEAAVDEFLGYIEDEPDGFRVLLRDTPKVQGVLTSWGTVIGDVADKVDVLLAAELDHRGFDRAIAPIYSRGAIGLIASVGQWWLETGTPERRVVAAHITNLVFNGIVGLELAPVLKTR